MNLPLSQIRILIAANELVVGGLQNQAILLGRYLQTQGAAVTLTGYGSAQSELIERYTSANLSWKQVPYPWKEGVIPSLRSLLRFRKIINELRPDIIIPFSGPSNLACNLVWKTTRAKVCIWNQRNAGREPLPTPLVRLALRLSSQCTSNNEMGSAYLRAHGCSSVIHLPDSIESFSRTDQKTTSLPSTDFTAIMTANFVEPKDHITLLRAWKIVIDHLSAAQKTAKLLLPGWHGPTFHEASMVAADLKIGSSVHFLGIRDDINELLAASDIYVHSSTSEGCPNAVLEAMQAGLAITGTNIPGTSNILPTVNKSYLVPPHDSEMLAKHIISLAEKPSLAKQIGQKNSKQFAKKFSPEKNGKRYMDTLLALIADK